MTLTRRQQAHVVAACYLGWTLDAFDFFIMIFVLGDIAKSFATDVTAVTIAITLTLAMRAVGAWVFGRIADRYGRRPTLIANVISYSVLEFASGFAPTLTVFILLRALYGVAMGGEWGIGASLTMESIPASWRGRVSGLLQAGYPSGYLLAGLLYWLAFPTLGWRGMFMVGALPALLVLYIRSNVPESAAWQAGRARAQRPILAVLRDHIPLTIFAVLMMAAFNFYSHGTQDLYPRFMQANLHFGRGTVTAISVAYNIAAMLGALVFGHVSQQRGRRFAIITAVLLSMPVIPLWAFSSAPLWVGLGAFLMQFCVQGAWGVIPAHLVELSPAEIRATFPGFTYQFGNLLAAANATIQSGIADRLGGDLRWPLAGVAGVMGLVIVALVASGREARHRSMGA